MSYTGKRPTFNTAALVPSSTAPANPVSGDMYVNDGSGSIEGGLYRYNGSFFVREDVREKNLIINGGFDFWQRGTSFTSTGGYTADRWRYDRSLTSAVVSLTRSADIPSPTGNYSLRLTATTGGALAAADFYNVRHFIEGFNIRELDGSPFVISFWVRSTVTGIHSISLYNSAADQYYTTSYTINTTNTWEKKYLRYPAFTISASWNITTDRGLVISIGAGGSSRQVAAVTTWTAGSTPFDAVTGQVNPFATTGNILAFSDFMLTKGEDHKANFQRAGHSIGEELVLCQRYYQKSYDTTVDPGTSDSNGSVGYLIDNLSSVSGRSLTVSPTFKVSMRSAPTITVYSVGGTSGLFRFGQDTIAPSSVDLIGVNGFRINGSTTTASDRALTQGHFVADAEIG